MKVKELLELLKDFDPEAVVLIRDNGSILPTDNLDEHEDYNVGHDGPEFYILASEEWEE